MIVFRRNKKNRIDKSLIIHLYIAGAWNTQGGGDGIILVGLGNEDLSYALHIDFQVMSNEVEYEALLVELGLANLVRAEYLKVREDSQLVVNQIPSQFQAKGVNMQAYVNRAIYMIRNLKKVTVT